jgi:hypothetical protein
MREGWPSGECSRELCLWSGQAYGTAAPRIPIAPTAGGHGGRRVPGRVLTTAIEPDSVPILHFFPGRLPWPRAERQGAGGYSCQIALLSQVA